MVQDKSKTTRETETTHDDDSSPLAGFGWCRRPTKQTQTD